ncbi:MAG: hypothetical protein KAT46_02215 [Deltaproteobacteria bacterium]|nr:hypothetical protein [Deltaproteobacteria bacterium]
MIQKTLNNPSKGITKKQFSKRSSMALQLDFEYFILSLLNSNKTKAKLLKNELLRNELYFITEKLLELNAKPRNIDNPPDNPNNNHE